MSHEEIAPLFGPGPTVPSQDVRFRQGTIVTFDQNTLQNTVLVGDTVLTNLPLQGVGEATLLVPGSVVGIMSVGDAAKTMYITGRIVIPNTADAASAVSLLNSQIYTDTVFENDTCTSTTYTDLTHPGPQVTVPVGTTGRILVILSVQISWSGVVPFGANASDVGRANVAFSGANTRSPDDAVDPLLCIDHVGVSVTTGTVSHARVASVTAQAIYAGLNPGGTTIVAKYRNNLAATNPSDFARRVLTVIKL